MSIINLDKTNSNSNANIILYGHETCSGCYTVKTFFKAREIDYEYVDITTEQGWEQYTKDFDGANAVPAVVINDTKLLGAQAVIKHINGI